MSVRTRMEALLESKKARQKALKLSDKDLVSACLDGKIGNPTERKTVAAMVKREGETKAAAYLRRRFGARAQFHHGGSL